MGKGEDKLHDLNHTEFVLCETFQLKLSSETVTVCKITPNSQSKKALEITAEQDFSYFAEMKSPAKKAFSKEF